MRHHLGPKLNAIHNITVRQHTRSAAKHAQDHAMDEPTPTPTGAVGHSGMSSDGPTEIHVHLYQPNASGLAQGGMRENEGEY
jgi:hypothetical protein